MTIVTHGDEATLEQIVKQLNKLPNVIKVQDFREGEYVDRELVLVKVAVDSKSRAEVMQITDIFRAKIVDVQPKSAHHRNHRRRKQGGEIHRTDEIRSACWKSPAPARSPCRASDRGGSERELSQLAAFRQPLLRIETIRASDNRSACLTAFAFDGCVLMFKIKSSFERVEDIEPTHRRERLNYGND